MKPGISTKKNKRKQYLLSLVEGAMMLALAWVIDFICALAPYNAILFPAGGSITVGMLPIIYFAYRHGATWGVGAGFVFSGLQLVMGWYPPPAGVWWAFVLCVLLDYVIAFTVVGLSPLFAHPFGEKTSVHRLVGYGVGAVAVCLLRYLSSVASGGLLWGTYAPEGMNPWIYSLVYNAGYMLPNAILTGILAVLLCRALDPRTGRPMKKAD
ncbi:MAG: energy-coupled thiamine transporter ThiT [Ruminococcaceae bacterium]|nr:energy-coupled thiamine transporter ThiT [Oscillospiraceae bacterium]